MTEVNEMVSGQPAARPRDVRIRELLTDLLLRDECRVDRYDASYLDDLPEILREMHGITAIPGAATPARAKLQELAALVGLPATTPLVELAPALRKAGVADDEFRPRRLSDPAMQDRFRYSRMPSWSETTGRRAVEGGDAVDVIRRFQEEYSRHRERRLSPLRCLWRRWQFKHGLPRRGLAQPGIGDLWTPMFQDFIRKGILQPNDPVLTIGPRALGEIKYFRKVIGLRKTIGLDLFSYNRRLVRVGDMHQMPFEDSRFALIFQRNTFDKAYDIRKVLRECVRTLRPGGILATDLSLDYTFGVDEAARTNITRNAWYLRFLGDDVAEILHDVQAPHTDDWARLVGQLAVRIRKS
jgi:SAM-dependent methyltransferase